MTSVSVVIPCFNDTEVLPGVLDELKHVIRDIPHIRWEIIVVDDHSEEPVADYLAACEGCEDVLVITHPVNRGYGASLKTGIRHARSEYILTMDSNASFDPLRAGPVNTSSSSQTLLNLSGSKISNYDSKADSTVCFHINIHHKEPIYSIYFFGFHIVAG